MPATAKTVTYAHVECVRAPETNPVDGRMMTPKLMAQCSNRKCRRHLEMGSLEETRRHDLRCPQCGGSDFRMSWWMATDSVNPLPACDLTNPMGSCA
ncbi:MAG: hypothetical protein OXK17_08480 [Thaumarchaeota archaeon]|nr:hypothetical protein [Nitrososphaerota archaeon]